MNLSIASLFPARIKSYELFPQVFNIEITTGQILVIIGAVIIGIGIVVELRDIRNGPRNNPPQPKEPA